MVIPCFVGRYYLHDHRIKTKGTVDKILFFLFKSKLRRTFLICNNFVRNRRDRQFSFTIIYPRINEKLPEVAFLKCCMFPIFCPFYKFSGRRGKSSHVSEQCANPILKI